jgi:hypothetical protein
MTTTPGQMYQEEFNGIVIKGGIWGTAPVNEEPEIRLSSWSIRELSDGDRHFVGYGDGEGRVSSKIITYDHETKRGVTRSGRVYELVGNPGVNNDAEYVWACWCVINEIHEWNDISTDI